MNVLLLQLDGKLPNIALMRIAAHHRPYADDIAFRHCATVKAVEASDWWGFDRIYASLIFERTRPVAEALLQKYRFAEVGGTGWDVGKRLEDIGIKTKQQDYGLYPHYQNSIGFTQRGCRLKCKFCVVPRKEGAVVEEQTILDIWRKEPYPGASCCWTTTSSGSPTGVSASRKSGRATSRWVSTRASTAA